MKWYKILILLAIQICNSTATEILYVLPDNSTDAVSCPSQPCATLSQYLSVNGTLPVVSNVEYHFLPGEHHVPANMTLQDLHNFSIIGTVSKPSPLAVLVLVDCPQSYIINIIDSYNVTISNVMFEQCDHPQLTNLLITLCYSCTIEDVIFIDLGLVGRNLIGTSYLSKIVIKASRKKSNFLMHTCQGIALTYWNHQPFIDHEHHLIMNQINIIGDGNKCHGNNHNSVGLSITIYAETLTITLTNSSFYYLAHTALFIDNKCRGKNAIYIKDCTVENNIRKYNSDDVQVTRQPLIHIVMAHNNKLIIFKHCNFRRNYFHTLLHFHVTSNNRCHGSKTDCISPLTNIHFVACHFNNNVVNGLIFIRGSLIYCRTNLLLIGPSHFSNNGKRNKFKGYSTIIYIYNMNINTTGSVILSSNDAHNIILFEKCDIIFHNKVIFKSNQCSQVLYLQSTYIRIMEYANVTFLENIHDTNDLIKTDCNYQYNLYPQCIFQFVQLTNTTTVSTAHYSINIIDYRNYNYRNMQQEEMCKFPLYITPHCKWIPTAAFQEYSSKVIYQQIIKFNNQKFIYHKICHCSPNGSTNCSVDTLGPVYPGQTLQVEFCTPCNDRPSTLFIYLLQLVRFRLQLKLQAQSVIILQK